jgi:hypothetical protein
MNSAAPVVIVVVVVVFLRLMTGLVARRLWPPIPAKDVTWRHNRKDDSNRSKHGDFIVVAYI